VRYRYRTRGREAAEAIGEEGFGRGAEHGKERTGTGGRGGGGGARRGRRRSWRGAARGDMDAAVAA